MFNDMNLFHKVVYKIIPVTMPDYLTLYSGDSRLRSTHLDNLCFVSNIASTKAKLLPLFKAQKKVMRVIFGDRAKYLDKFKTCARVRPLNEQRLLTEFFIKEHSKPLFNSLAFLI